MKLTRAKLRGSFPERLAPTEEIVRAASDFVFEKWVERAKERGWELPTDLSWACKFASLFAVCVFGGRMRGNDEHQYAVHPTYGIIDLTNGVMGREMGHDAGWWANKDHVESMQSCVPRVERWVEEFLREQAFDKTRRIIEDHEIAIIDQERENAKRNRRARERFGVADPGTHLRRTKTVGRYRR